MKARRELEWVGSVLAVCGTLLIATGHPGALNPAPWVVLMVASFALFFWALSVRAWGFLVLNVIYFSLDLIGLFNAIK